MDFSKFKTPDWLMIGGGVGIFVFGFLKWVTVSFEGVDLGGGGNVFDFFWTGTIPWILLIASAVVTVLLIQGTLKQDQLPWPLVLLAATVLASLLLLIRLIFNPIEGSGGAFGGEIGRGIGMILSVISGLVATAGAFLNFQASGGDIKDLTDLANGTRLVIEVKNGINPDALADELYRLTKLEDSFAINNVALVEGQPSTLTLKQLLEVYLAHRLQVIRRRTAFLLGKARDRMHLVEGLLLAIVDIDDVIVIIRSSEDSTQARTRLMDAFELSEVQANYILDMQLRRLTKMSTIELESEREKLWLTIADLSDILESDERLREVTATELDEVARTHGTPRRTILLASGGGQVTAARATKGGASLEIADDPCWVMLSSTGLLARTDNDEPLPTSGPRATHDVIVSAVRATARGEFCALTNQGRLLRGQAVDVPSVPVTAAAPNLQGGSLAAELLPLQPGERILGLGTLGGQERDEGADDLLAVTHDRDVGVPVLGLERGQGVAGVAGSVGPFDLLGF